MPLNNIQDIEKALRLEEGTISNAISSEEEVSISIPENLVIRTNEEIETREKNLKETSKQAGIEIAIKNTRSELGLEFEGKTMDNLLSAYKDKLTNDLTKEPNSIIEDLKKDKEKFQNIVKEKDSQIETLNSSITNIKNKAVIESSVIRAFGQVTEGVKTSIPTQDIRDLFMLKNQIDIQDGKTVVLRDGEVVKDQTTLEPISVNDVASEFIKGYVQTPEGGTGKADNNGGAASGTFDAFSKEMESKGVRVGSEQYNTEMNSRIANGTLTDV
jgi:hypothetical protein